MQDRIEVDVKIKLITNYVKNFFKMRLVMKNKEAAMLMGALTLSILFFIGCDLLFGTEEKVNYGNISGTAKYLNSDDHAGIVISLELVEGARTVGISNSIQQSDISRGIIPSRNIVGKTTTNEQGAFSIQNIIPGKYTIYASSSDSREKAVHTSVIVRGGETVTTPEILLTPIGHIKGKIVLDGKETGNLGFLVFIAETSYLAVSGDSGKFMINDVPVGLSYSLIAMRGNYVNAWHTADVSAGAVTDIGTLNLSSGDVFSPEASTAWITGSGAPDSAFGTNNTLYLDVDTGDVYEKDEDKWNLITNIRGSDGQDGTDGKDAVPILWKGSFANAEAMQEPERNWAYYNTESGNSYLYDGDEWVLLAKAGAAGAPGSSGASGADGISIIWKGELTEAPSEPEFNWAYYNSEQGTSYIWNGAQWNILAQDGSDGQDGTDGKDAVPILWKGSFANAEAMQEPERNWAYYNTESGNSYLYDGDEWVLLAKAGASGADGISIIWKGELTEAPSEPEFNWAYYNSEQGTSYIWNGIQWNILAQDGEFPLIEPPEKPSIDFPGTTEQPGSFLPALTTTLTWEEAEGSAVYSVKISKYPYGPNHIIHNPHNISGTSYTVPEGVLQWGESYRWNIQAGNQGGWSDVSESLYFRIADYVEKEGEFASLGLYHTMLIKEDGTLWASGRNNYGQLGDGTTVDRYTSVKIMDDVKTVSAGSEHTMVIKNDNTLWATGRNDYGQLGDNNRFNKSTLKKIMDDVKAVSAGSDHTLIVKTDGSVWAAGRNQRGQLGDGTTADKLEFTKIEVDGLVKAVAAGERHSLIVKEDGTLKAFGDNNYGQLGDGTTSRKTSPVVIINEGVSYVSAGMDHSMICMQDGSWHVTGRNSYGQLGIGFTDTYITSAQPIMGSSLSIVSVSSFDEHILILMEDGKLYAAGRNNYGQLGTDGYEQKYYSPILIAKDIISAAAGGYHSVIRKADGTLYGVGFDLFGQLGSWKIPGTYSYGDTGPAGGVVFYIDEDNEFDWTYLEAAPCGWDNGGDDPEIEWGGHGILIGGTSESIGTGKENTQTIIDFWEEWRQHRIDNTTYSDSYTSEFDYSDAGVQAHLSAGRIPLRVDQSHNPSQWTWLDNYAAQACAEYSVRIDGIDYEDWFFPSLDELGLMSQNLYQHGFGGITSSHWMWSSSENSATTVRYMRMFRGTVGTYSKLYAGPVRPIRTF